MIEIKPLSWGAKENSLKVNIFLAGSIEMGGAEEWQTRVLRDLADIDAVAFNPRRDDWDSSWHDDGEEFKLQVDWELNGQELVDLIVFYFAGNTLSPISLLELGLAIGSGKKILVYYDQAYQRKGNVIETCKFYDYPVFSDYQEWLNAIRAEILTIEKYGYNLR